MITSNHSYINCVQHYSINCCKRWYQFKSIQINPKYLISIHIFADTVVQFNHIPFSNILNMVQIAILNCNWSSTCFSIINTTKIFKLHWYHFDCISTIIKQVDMIIHIGLMIVCCYLIVSNISIWCIIRLVEDVITMRLVIFALYLLLVTRLDGFGSGNNMWFDVLLRR